MFSKNVLSHWRLLVGVFALLLWSACDPMPPGPTCDDDVPGIIISDGECAPAILNFFSLDEQQPGAIPALADFCATDYSVSRVFRLPPVSQQLTEALAVYTNFPATLTVEIIGSNCQGNLPFLIECYTVEAVADLIELDLSGSTGVEDLLVRLVATPNDVGYQPGTDTRDVISVSAFDFVPTGTEFDDGTLIACDGKSFQRMVLSAPLGNGDDIAAILGLPVAESCSCSEGSLLALDVPYGIDLLALKPKLRDRTAQALTDTFDLAFDLDYLIPRPNLDQSSFDPNDDVAFANAANCVSFGPANVGSPTDPEQGVIVAFVDSGVDIDNWGASVFGQNTYRGETPSCWTDGGLFFSEFGYDLIFNDPIPNDISGHGTDVSGAFVNQYDSSVPLSLLHFKFFAADAGSYFDALCGSYLAANSGADVINWSWGFEETSLPRSLANLLSFLQDNNVIVVAAAGNNGVDISTNPVYPAAATPSYNNMVSVGSYSYIDNPVTLVPTLLEFSNFSNDRVSIAAYGIAETPLAGTDLVHRPIGTSISAPLVAKQLARFKAIDLEAVPEDVIQSFFDQVLFDVPLGLVIVDGKYLQLGCVDDDYPEP